MDCTALVLHWHCTGTALVLPSPLTALHGEGNSSTGSCVGFEPMIQTAEPPAQPGSMASAAPSVSTYLSLSPTV